jgi:N-acetylglucosaminyldiphosphoundecaprenol N-acetyl-beta-D-mannosaminyltransferase
VLGVKVDAVQIPGVIRQMQEWIARRNGCQYIAVTGMHGITEAHHDAKFKNVLNAADLVVPDGMPLVWLGRLRGYALRRRVYGPELMLRFCMETAAGGCRCRHFFYGGDTGVAEDLEDVFKARCPGVTIAGSYSPPFRELSPREDAEIVAIINAAQPDILWVGLSTPKQEKWMHEHRDRLRVPVMVGVGAAFDFISQRKKQAPHWMQEHGLEWMFRLGQEPRRLWRRYILGGAEFVFLVALELLGIRRFGGD